jgi:hypothetical protein
MQQVTFNALSDAKCKIYNSFIQVLFISKVNMETSTLAVEIKELLSTVEKHHIAVAHLKGKLKTVEEEGIKFKAQHAHLGELIAWVEHILQETET